MVPNHARYHLRYTPIPLLSDKAYKIIIKSAEFVKGLAAVMQKSRLIRREVATAAGLYRSRAAA